MSKIEKEVKICSRVMHKLYLYKLQNKRSVSLN